MEKPNELGECPIVVKSAVGRILSISDTAALSIAIIFSIIGIFSFHNVGIELMTILQLYYFGPALLSSETFNNEYLDISYYRYWVNGFN